MRDGGGSVGVTSRRPGRSSATMFDVTNASDRTSAVSRTLATCPPPTNPQREPGRSLLTPSLTLRVGMRGSAAIFIRLQTVATWRTRTVRSSSLFGNFGGVSTGRATACGMIGVLSEPMRDPILSRLRPSWETAISAGSAPPWTARTLSRNGSATPRLGAMTFSWVSHQSHFRSQPIIAHPTSREETARPQESARPANAEPVRKPFGSVAARQRSRSSFALASIRAEMILRESRRVRMKDRSRRETRTLSPIGTIKPVRAGRLRIALYSVNMRPVLISPHPLRLSRRGHLALWFSND